jgi:hypothetical protein
MSKTEFKAGGSAKPKLDKPSRVISAFSVMRVEGGWAYVRLAVDQDYNVLSAEVSQPDTKPIITERFRIEVGKYWGTLDEQTI